MKKYFLISFVFIIQSLFAQSQREIDSLNNVLTTSSQDTSKVMALCRLSFIGGNPAKKLSLANEALVLARKIKFEKGEAQGYQTLGSYFSAISDYPQSLEYHLKALKIREKINYHAGRYSSLNSIGLVYASQQNNQTAMAYYFQALEILKRTDVPLEGLYLFGRIGEIYLRQHKLDSALIYYTKSYEKARKAPDKYHLSVPLMGLGDVHSAMDNIDLAFSYYRLSISSAKKNNNPGNLSQYLALAKLFSKTGRRDSAIYYAKKTLTIFDFHQNKTGVMNAAKLLGQLYENRDGNEAARFYKMALEATDSIFSGSNMAQIQNLGFKEQERQRELAEANLRNKEDRKHNLQYVAIAIGLISFIILFFLVSRSIIVKTKFIEYSGVLGLLAVFEFINLFIHPYLAHATNDSPLLMLVVLIIIGALLVPLHHKLEKWMTKIMVEKNKKIRLEAARKTIATLEPTN